MKTPPLLRCTAVALCLAPVAGQTPAQTSSCRPQIVFAVGNSESMDGTLSGAIMTGSGMSSGSSSIGSLTGSSSPVNYAVPSGFTPPKQAADASGNAPYTVSSSGTLYDNGASRLNVAKAGIASTLSTYLSSMDFGLVTYSTSGSSVYTTWAYHMSPLGGFNFTNTQVAGKRYVVNPCYSSTGAAGLSSTVKTNCAAIVSANLYNSTQAPGGIYANQYMEISASADDANINDVLYAGSLTTLWVDYGTVTTNNGVNVTPPSTNTPYTAYGLASYNNGGILVGYASSAPSSSTAKQTSPTNAGYVPFSSQVMYVQRGFGYGGSQSATTGATQVGVTSLGNSPSASAISTATAKFTPFLAPETNSISTTEIKAIAGQAATAGLMVGAKTALGAVTASGGGQYVILLTDGLPTLDLNNKAWPPLGSAAGYGYGVYATFAGVAANTPYGMKDGTSSTLAAGTLVASGTNDQALIDTITQISALNAKGIKTYVVGLGAGVDATQNPAANAALNAMAIAGGTGQQYPASDIPSFQAALAAIAAQIYANTQVSAPIAPGTVTSGSKVYTVTSSNQSGSVGGHIQAYNTDTTPGAVPGTVTGSALWDAGSASLMSTSTRINNIWSTNSAGTLTKLSVLGDSTQTSTYDPAAFGWTASSATTCVPKVATILAYTFNPTYGSTSDTGSTGMGFPTPVSGCTYLAGRAANWMLGSMSANDGVQYLGAPGSSSLLGLPGYPAFAANNQGRAGMVLAASNDGILYGINAATGTMQWGWMPRPFVSKLAQYTSLLSQQLFDGGFRVVDAPDSTASTATASNWASYVVGMAQGGAYYYALKLSSNTSNTSTAAPSPVAQAWGISVSGGKAPIAGTISGTNSIPRQMQPPMVVTVGGKQVALFIVNTSTTSGGTTTTTSTLYEVNVATGLPATGSALSFTANSAMSYDALTGTLWLGDNAGGVWSVSVTGQPAADAATAIKAGTTNPADAINFVGYGEANGMPYVWATSDTKLTMFALAGTGSIAWATAGGSSPKGYQGTTAVSSGIVRPLQSTGIISAAPVLANGVLTVPVFVPASNSCGSGTGYYQFFDMATGGAPKTTVTYNGQNITNATVYLGAGAPLAVGLHGSARGLIGFPGTNTPSSSGGGQGTLGFGGAPLSHTVLWRQR